MRYGNSTRRVTDVRSGNGAKRGIVWKPKLVNSRAEARASLVGRFSNPKYEEMEKREKKEI